jgi:hypothetical protein
MAAAKKGAANGKKGAAPARKSAPKRAAAGGSKAGRAKGAKLKTPAQKSAATRKRKAARRKAELAAARAPSEVVDEAEAKGAARTVENAKLYQEVMRDWTRGYTFDGLAAKHKLSAERCRQIVDDLKGSRLMRLGVTDPLFGARVVNDLLLRHSAAVGEYAQLADATPRNQPGVKLAALKQRDQALREFTDLMQELGYLPRHLGQLTALSDLIGMAEAAIDVLEQHKVPEAVIRALIEAMELRVRRQRGGGLALDMSGPHETVNGTAEEVRDGETRTVAA